MEQRLPGKYKKGYILLISVIFLGSITLSLSLYFSWLASFKLRSGIDYEQAKQAEYLAELCAENALQEIWNNTTFTTNSTSIPFSSGECSYQVVNMGGESRHIYSTGTVNEKVKKIQVIVDAVNSSVDVSSWKMVADFN